MPVDLDLVIVGKVLLAAVLGGLVGLEREIRRRSAGLRTVMFISIGSTLFTILSIEIGRRTGGEPTRIVSNLIPGIGFLGAGAILHSQSGGEVIGLTTAAVIFVMASVGMAIGGGLYATAIFTTLLILVILVALGLAEKRFEKKN